MKTSTTNLQKRKIKYLFVARGPGETAQAVALARYFAKRRSEVLFGLLQEKNKFFFEKNEFKLFLTPTPAELKKLLEKEKPSVLLFFNSKIWGGKFSEMPAFPKPFLSLALDSNWLFNEKKYPHYAFLKWVDGYLVFFPKKIFDLGLKQNKGNFEIEKSVFRKITPVGFVPSYKKPPRSVCLKIRKKYGISGNEKFIFAYFSGFGAGHRVWALENFIKAVDKSIKKGKIIKAIYVGPTEDLDPKKIKRPWLLLKEKLPSRDYFLTLASADLVFQHQGMATLAQAICCQVPVIANVSLLKKEALAKIHFWEVKPFVRAGACLMFSKSSSIQEISRGIETLLYNKKAIEKMRKNQKAIFEEGESKTLNIIKKLLAKKNEKIKNRSNLSIKSAGAA